MELFRGCGPFRLEDSKFYLNNYSWHEKVDLLLIEQPYGTGYSF